MLDSYIQGVEDAFAKITDSATNLGAVKNRIDHSRLRQVPDGLGRSRYRPARRRRHERRNRPACRPSRSSSSSASRRSRSPTSPEHPVALPLSLRPSGRAALLAKRGLFVWRDAARTPQFRLSSCSRPQSYKPRTSFSALSSPLRQVGPAAICAAQRHDAALSYRCKPGMSPKTQFNRIKGTSLWLVCLPTRPQ